MGTICARASLILMLITCCSQSPLLASGQEETANPGFMGRVTTEQAKALEEGLKAKPDDLSAREKLITYYFQAMIASRSAEFEDKREEHIFWMIEHHPEVRFAGSPEAHIEPVGLSESTEGYEHGKELWLQQVKLHPDNPQILLNAAEFFSLWDRKLGRDLLDKAAALDPSDEEISAALAQSYMQERLLAKSPEEKAALAAKALAARERALDSAEGEERFDGLDDLATEAFEAGDIAKAERYASELLQSSQQYKGNWNYGNAIHKGNIVLGRIALTRGDIAAAKERLLAAGQTPGSPQLDSFGPNMTLAKELLEKGEREAVITYLESCAKFWMMGGTELKGWIATIKSGGVPDFGGNLLY